MKHPREYRGKQVVILGLALSGLAAAKVFHELGAVVVANDRKERQLCPEADELEAMGISVICGFHPESLIHAGVSLLVKNPGIPYHAGPVVQALELGIEVVTEVEVAYHLSQAPIIGITGSNGKTTTTTWVGRIFEAAGLNPIVAGNIGRSLCDAVAAAGPENWMVVELSSFQLKGTDQFHPKIACLLNIYETHLDYHGTMDDYTESKVKIFVNQNEHDLAIVNWDDEICRRMIPYLKADVLPFSRIKELAYGVYTAKPGTGAEDEPWIVYRDKQGEKFEILAVKDIGILGKHNVENALAATAAAVGAGVSHEVIARELRDFRGVEHRQELVGVHKAVTFYNDSKATNPSATIKALESFEQPIVLIAGGLDRGMDYMELLPYFQKKVKALVTLGETKEKINGIARMAGIRSIKSVDTAKTGADAVNEAVKLAVPFAEEGDVVLFSPACASWDMFTSYEERGRMFKESVHTL
ncbi:MAG TPA: UDP-N-acetylmuramoyl-L-alanine--D-glutamate ligase [Bacilli bacterium]